MSGNCRSCHYRYSGADARSHNLITESEYQWYLNTELVVDYCYLGNGRERPHWVSGNDSCGSWEPFKK